MSIFLWACQPPKAPSEKKMEEVKTEEYTPQYSLDFLLGKFDPTTHQDFVAIEPQFANREGMWMQKQAYEAFLKMWKAAQAEEVNLTIVSAARNFDYQKGIWERKWFGKTLLNGSTDATTIDSLERRALAIMQYSAMPGASRHHWGTDIDLNALNNDYFTQGRGKEEFDWLVDNAINFGFCRPYTEKSAGRTGYEEEKWHWSYLPLSRIMTKDAQVLFEDQLLSGFEGHHTAQKLQIKQNYILGISEACF